MTEEEDIDREIRSNELERAVDDAMRGLDQRGWQPADQDDLDLVTAALVQAAVLGFKSGAVSMTAEWQRELDKHGTQLTFRPRFVVALPFGDPDDPEDDGYWES